VPAEQFGPYVVYEELGVGGMAAVHRAEIRTIEGFRKPVALKRLHPYLTATPEIVQSFVREGKLASHLHHANIAQTFELGKAEGTYFISMEYVPGPTLTQLMRQCQLAAGAIPIAVTLGILYQICDALDYAHNRRDDHDRPLGIIHRDVSPSNIIISSTGNVKLIDFGIAKVKSRSEVDTPVGIVIKGKFDYIAPEYLGGQLDLRADLFALGVVAHELLTGRKLFDGADDFETSTLVLDMPIQPPSRWNSQVSNELDHIVLTALQRDPDLRWRSASAMQAALLRLGRETKAMATAQHIREWVRWAFTQVRTKAEDTELERVIEMLDEPSSVQIELSPAQQQILNEFDQPLETLLGVAPTGPGASILLQPVPQTPPPLRAAPTGSRPPEQAIPTAKLAAPIQPLSPDDSGEIVAPPQRERHTLRYIAFVVVLLVAAGAGVAVTAYALGVDLPFT